MKTLFALLFFALLTSTLIACKGEQPAGKDPSGDSSGLNGFHKVISGISGRAVYTVISFPSDTSVEIRKYYLDQNKSPATFSIDNATVSKSGHTWNLTFNNSDCAPNNSTAQWNVILNDDTEFDFQESSSPTVTYRFPSTDTTYPKLEQYDIWSYTQSSSYCD